MPPKRRLFYLPQNCFSRGSVVRDGDGVECGEEGVGREAITLFTSGPRLLKFS